MSYQKNPLKKLKEDILANAFYDVIKFTILWIIGMFIVKYLPFIKKWMEIEFTVTFWLLVIMLLFLIIFVSMIMFLLFNIKIKKIESKNHIDTLTGLKNSEALEIELSNIENQLNTEDSYTSLIIIDIDNFKRINDENSYQIADKILSKLWILLNNDSRSTDQVFRYFVKGDEFIIIAKDTNISNAHLAAERKRKLIENTAFVIDWKTFNITVSCGVTEFTFGEQKDIVIQRLNKALQEAKSVKWKNCTKINI